MYKFIRYIKNFDETAFVNELEDTPFSLVYSSDDPNVQLELLNNFLVECIDRHAPLRRVRFTRPPAPWTETEEIRSLQTKKDKQV